MFPLHFCRRKYQCIFDHFYANAQKVTEFGENTQPLGLLRRSRSFKVTEFGANRKIICNFLLVINSFLIPILHRFRDIALERCTRNSSGDEIASVNFLYDDIVHVLQNTIDSCINSATDRRGYVCWNACLTKFSEITQCNGHYAVQGHSR